MKILLIDDELSGITTMEKMLDPAGHECVLCQDPIKGIEKFKMNNFDVVITDFKMPHMNGIKVLKEIRKYKPDACVIILTGYADTENAIASVNCGAYSYFRKPLNINKFMDTLSKIEKELCQTKEINSKIQEVRKTLHLRDTLSTELEDLTIAQRSTLVLQDNITSLLSEMQTQSTEFFTRNIEFLAKAIEARDKYTSGHIGRVTAYTLAIASKLGWNQNRLEQAYLGSLMHDIGKIGVPDYILNKPGILTDEEFEVVKTHVTIGVNMVIDVPRINELIDYIRCHHEHYDGQGYLDGLQGEDIPIEGRIVCVADSYDTLTTDRPYRKGMPVKDAVAELRKHSGSQFDPEMVTVFISTLQDFKRERMVPNARN